MKGKFFVMDNNTEMALRIEQAKMSFHRMKSVLTNEVISIHTRVLY